MKRSNKALYEKIMRNVSKEVKRSLNEARGPVTKYDNYVSDIIAYINKNVTPNIDDINPIKTILNKIMNYYKQNPDITLHRPAGPLTEEMIDKIIRDWLYGSPYTGKLTTEDLDEFILEQHDGEKFPDYYGDYLSEEGVEYRNNTSHEITGIVNGIFDEIIDEDQEKNPDDWEGYDSFSDVVDEYEFFDGMSLFADILSGDESPESLQDFLDNYIERYACSFDSEGYVYDTLCP